MIISSEYQPGQRLSETSLSEQFKVNRSCIREALIMLESKKLVEREANKYTRVVDITDHDAEEILNLRIAIEQLCYKTCVKNNCLPIAELRAQNERLLAICTLKSTSIFEKLTEDFELHKLTVTASGNLHMAGIWESLEAQMKLLLFAAIRANIIESGISVTSGVGDHTTMINSLENGMKNPRCIEAAAEALSVNITDGYVVYKKWKSSAENKS